jgi:aryl-alcohol dehydrogenase-like predicted oxidoreductase
MFEKLILGGAQLGLNYGISRKNDYFSLDNSLSIVQRAYELGFKSVDIAYEYGSIFENINQFNPGLKVISKIKLFSNKSYCRQIYEHENIKNLDYILIHDADNFNGSVEHCELVYDFLSKCKRLKVNWGLSIYEVQSLNKFIHMNYVPKLVQYPYNILHKSDAIGEVCKLHDIKTQIRSVFLQGILLNQNKVSLPKNFRNNDILNAYQSWLQMNEQNPMDVCLRANSVYFRSKVIGVETVPQLEQLVQQALGNPISTKNLGVTDDQNLLDPRSWKKY